MRTKKLNKINPKKNSTKKSNIGAPTSVIQLNMILKQKKYFTNNLHCKKKNNPTMNNLITDNIEILDTLCKKYNKFVDILIDMWNICIDQKNIDYAYNKLKKYYISFKEKKEKSYDLDYNDLVKINTDIYNLIKIDNHIHASAMMTSNELKNYMSSVQKERKKKITLSKLNTLVDIEKKNKRDEHYSRF